MKELNPERRKEYEEKMRNLTQEQRISLGIALDTDYLGVWNVYSEYQKEIRMRENYLRGNIESARERYGDNPNIPNSFSEQKRENEERIELLKGRIKTLTEILGVTNDVAILNAELQMKQDRRDKK